MTVLSSLIGRQRGAAQVAATGQALMQSQRLAKSVSQALIGNPAAFPEVKESAEVLAEQRARPEDRRGSVPAAPAERAGRRSTRSLPLVDRAEKNASTVARASRRC